MRNLICPDDCPTLFDMHPEGAEPPVSQRVITPGCLLPAPAHHFVDAERAAAILNVSKTVVLEMQRAGALTGYKAGKSTAWNISYASIVDLCDRLRIQFSIKDRRPKLSPGRRWRDADLLPFPKSDTVTIQDVMIGLDCNKQVALNLVEEGAFEAYRLLKGSPWRISKTSLFAYRDRKRAAIAQTSFRGRPARAKPRR